MPDQQAAFWGRLQALGLQGFRGVGLRVSEFGVYSPGLGVVGSCGFIPGIHGFGLWVWAFLHARLYGLQLLGVLTKRFRVICCITGWLSNMIRDMIGFLRVLRLFV